VTDIQQAPDVLATWADGTTPRPWAVEEIPETGECRIVMVDEDLDAPTIIAVTSGGMTRADASLIVGIVGNPELFAAISQMLESAGYWGDAQPMLSNYANRIAAAIIVADQRINA